MNNSDHSSEELVKRRKTNIYGLDILLGEGLVENNLYLIEGPTGSGKTILANQISFEYARQGLPVLYITLMAESHGKLLRQIREFSFFDSELLLSKLQFISGYRAMIEDGLEGLLTQIMELVEKYAPKLIVIDGFSTYRMTSATALEVSKFIHSLNLFCSTAESSALLLNAERPAEAHPEQALVDSIIEVQLVPCGLKTVRQIEIHKLRGARHLMGRHYSEITDEGIKIYPRAEARWKADTQMKLELNTRKTMGIPTLDQILMGGVPACSTTALLGDSGTGKTTIGVHFLSSGAANNEIGLYFGFYERPEALVNKIEKIGLPLGKQIRDGKIRLLWNAPTELIIDKLADILISEVTKIGATRVFIDGVDGLVESTSHRSRVQTFLAALSLKLRSLAVTCLYSEEIPLFSKDLKTEVTELSAVVDNVIVCRYSNNGRTISVVKLRDSDFDPTTRPFHISTEGVHVELNKDHARHQPTETTESRRPNGVQNI